MEVIMDIADRHNLLVIEDAAQGIMGSFQNRPLGSIGHLAALSFHETKNIISGEGGALLINDRMYAERAEIIWEKGTDRGKFFRGEVDKYTWVDIGSSFLPSELVAAFLSAQMDQADIITSQRLDIWEYYHAHFAELEAAGMLRRPIIPNDCRHNAHMYYILLPDQQTRARLIAALKAHSIHSVFHYIPLHSSPMGLKVGRTAGSLPVTETIAERLLRLPLWIGDVIAPEVVQAVKAAMV
jgi:dTDP-4-amino-4,6-dideoxygalactose transaminase